MKNITFLIFAIFLITVHSSQIGAQSLRQWAREQIQQDTPLSPRPATDQTASIEPLMKRGYLFLEDSDWRQAREYFDRVLDIDPEYAIAYTGKLCAELGVRSEKDLGALTRSFSDYRNYELAVRFADPAYRKTLEGYAKAAAEAYQAQLEQRAKEEQQEIDERNRRTCETQQARNAIARQERERQEEAAWQSKVAKILPQLRPYELEKGLKVADMKVGLRWTSEKTLAHFAAAEGRLDVLKLLNTLHPDIIKMPIRYSGRVADFGEDHEWKPIHLAAFNGQIETMKWLIAQGVDINETTRDFRINNEGTGPIHCAALGGQIETMKWLKRQGVGINTSTGYGGDGTPMEIAASRGHLEVMKWLKEQGVDPKGSGGSTPMHKAATGGHLEVMKWLKEQGVDDPNATSGAALSPMYCAAWGGHVEVMKWLKEQGADPTVGAGSQGDDGWRPIHGAAIKGHVEAMKWLKEQGADIRVDSPIYGCTPMHCAAMGEHIEAMKWLKEQGVDVNIRTEGEGIVPGGAPIHRAARDGSLEVIKWLKEQGADINAKAARGMAPIHYAVGFEVETMKCLVKLGADINAKDDEGRTPLAHVRQRLGGTGKDAIIQWLIDNGARE